MSSSLDRLVHLFELEHRRQPTDSEMLLLEARRDAVEVRIRTLIQEYLENSKLEEEVDKLVEFLLEEDANGGAVYETFEKVRDQLEPIKDLLDDCQHQLDLAKIYKMNHYCTGLPAFLGMVEGSVEEVEAKLCKARQELESTLKYISKNS